MRCRRACSPSCCARECCWLPAVQMRRARLLMELGRTHDALDLIDYGNLGSPIAGANSPRVDAERNALRARAGSGPPANVATALLGDPTKLQPSAFAAAARR